MVKISQDLIAVGRRNRPGRVNPMEFITIHNTGNPSAGATASAHARYVRGDVAASIPASWHYTVDCIEAWQHLPDNEDAFHAGDGAGAGNRRSIGIEIAENRDGNLQRATDNAVLLTAYLCHKHNIPVANIRQHSDWSSRSGCPARLRRGQPYSWQTFIANVTAELARLNQPPPSPTAQLFRVQVGAYRVRANAERMVARAKAAGFTDAFIAQSGDLMRVQIGAFAQRANANARRQEAIAAGFAGAFVTQKT
ncbi:MAG: N-acetylmuramoyl-L-alanine amidase [Oscillospiraceae bacterium]|nr:N-acetylmuramoyl-L-alanine amidase [Oscillospiraceae bacterium]